MDAIEISARRSRRSDASSRFSALVIAPPPPARWEGDFHQRSLLLAALDGKAGPVGFDQSLSQRQPKSRAPVGRVVEMRWNGCSAAPSSVRSCDAGVAHADHRLPASFSAVETMTCPPGSLNFTAFDIKFSMICRSERRRR